MSRKYFGTDGVRGKVGVAPITPDFVMRLGYAAGKVLASRESGERATVLIGKDTRVSGYMLESALEAGFAAAGVDVLLVGPMPTPAVAYLARALRLAAGVVISASHNPYDDNGIKFFNGDGDRLVMADARGVVYDGDQLLYVIARDAQRRRRLDGGVVGTLMSNLAFENALGKLKIPFARANVGDRYVLETMVARGWKFGGENSGHILCLDQHTTGDAIVAALQVLRALCESRLTLAQACAPVVLYPQVMINVPVKRRADFQAQPAVAAAVKKAQGDLASEGRVLLRASGTEPVIRVMVEARSRVKASRWAKAIASVVRAAGE